MALEADAAERIVYGPFPRSVGVTVEDDSSLDFACGLFVSGNVVTGLLFEKEVDRFLIYAELKKNDNEAEYD